MCPDIDWRVDDNSGEHTVVKISPENLSRRRRIMLGVVILIGAGLGVIYSSIPGPALPPTIAVRLTSTSGPSGPHVPIALPTVTLSPNSSDSALYPVSTSVSSPLACASTLASAWRLWRSEGYPYAVRALLMDQDRLWAGTASGLYNVDPRTDQYTPALPYETTGGISMLLPLGDGRLWVEGDLGHFYYDTRQWFQVWILGLSNKPSNMVAIDQNGDLWIGQAIQDSRWPNLYHLPGHIPPSDRPWPAKAEDPFWSNSDTCTWQAYTSGRISYRSTAECESQYQAITSFAPNFAADYSSLDVFSRATDMDGSLWWIHSGTNSRTLLKRAPNGYLSTFEFPATYDTQGWEFAYPLAPDPIHGVWRGDGQGLVYTDGVNTRRIDFADEPCTVVWPNDLAIDAAGTVWLGTANGQILKQAYAETNWTAISLPDLPQSKPGQPILAVAAAPDGRLWATHGYDLFNVSSDATHQARVA